VCHLEERQKRAQVILVDDMKRSGDPPDLQECPLIQNSMTHGRTGGDDDSEKEEPLQN
jgi:hypothetical protein